MNAELAKYQQLAAQGKLYFRTLNQREQPVRVKVLQVTSFDKGYLMIWTRLTPAKVKPNQLEVTK